MKVFELNTVSLNNLNTFKKREIVLKHLVKYGIQRVHTPFSLVNYMIPKDLPGSVCVIFNLEFLEVLKFSRKYDMSKVTFFGDSEVEVLFAKKIYNVENSFLVNEETWKKIIRKEINPQEVFMSKMKEAPDITFSNPPYNDNLDLKIIMALKEVNCLKKLICVHPSTWLVSIKQNSKKLYKNFKEIVKNHSVSFDLFNGNPIFKIGLYVPCMISKFDFTKQINEITIKDKKIRKVNNIEDITLFGESWYLVKDLKDKLENFIDNKNSLKKNQSFIEENLEKKYVQLSVIRGHAKFELTDKFETLEKDFFTFLQKDVEKNKGTRRIEKINNPEANTIIFSFETEIEQENFLKYLQTDFARFCLSIYKLNNNVNRGELEIVPWLDFSKSWTDDELFSFFGFERGHPLREYTKTFLPDYHNIYPNGKDY